MVSLKLLVALALVALVCAADDLVYSTDLMFGERKDNDQLIYKEKVIESYSWIGSVVYSDREFSVPEGFIITEVNAINHESEETGARVTVIDGGPNTRSVKLGFKSQRYNGINFTVELYALKE